MVLPIMFSRRRCGSSPPILRQIGAIYRHMSGYAKFYFRPAEGEQIKTAVHIEPDCRSALCGVVLDMHERPVRDALVLLLRASDDGGDDMILAYCFTSEDGSFVFGPLQGNALYLVRIFKSSVRLRELEIKLE